MPEFRKVASIGEIPPGTSKKVEVDGKCVALFNIDGELSAIQERCPHRGGPLSEGIVQGGQVTCPWHAWSFNLRTGDRVGFPPGMGKIQTYNVRIEGNDILVEC